MPDKKIIVFEGNKIRRTFYNNEWWFCVADVVEILTDTVNSSDYIKKLKKRDPELSQGWGQIVTPLAIETAGGKITFKNQPIIEIAIIGAIILPCIINLDKIFKNLCVYILHPLTSFINSFIN